MVVMVVSVVGQFLAYVSTVAALVTTAAMRYRHRALTLKEFLVRYRQRQLQETNTLERKMRKKWGGTVKKSPTCPLDFSKPKTVPLSHCCYCCYCCCYYY